MSRDDVSHRQRVLVISHDLVGERMAGPGIRYWELSRALAETCAVTLAVPGQPPDGGGLRCVAYEPQDGETIRRAAEDADVIVAYGYLLYRFPFLADLGTPLALDLYIPGPTEALALHASRPLEWQEGQQQADLALLARVIGAGDFIFCASERQRDFWLGFLAAAGRLAPSGFAADPTFRRLIDVVPFGLPGQAPRRGAPLFKGIVPGIAEHDRLLLWGGGVWDWLDPLTLSRALGRVSAQRPEIKCVFPGGRHPWTERVPVMPMLQRAQELSRQMGLTDRVVFWGDWIPYERRGDYLLEADLGISLHQDSVETRFAFRTRILDYIWAGLPMVVSEGDALAEVVAARDLGRVIGYGDVEGLAEAIVTLLDEPQARVRRQAAFAELAAQLAWPAVARPLVRFCQAPRRAADKGRRRGPEATVAGWAMAAELTRCEAERRELQTLVDGYRRGRVMRLLAGAERLREWISGQRRPKPEKSA